VLARVVAEAAVAECLEEPLRYQLARERPEDGPGRRAHGGQLAQAPVRVAAAQEVQGRGARPPDLGPARRSRHRSRKGAHAHLVLAGPRERAEPVWRTGATDAVIAPEHAEFLNAKAASDPLGLYNTGMGSDADFGGITRSGSSGSYAYSVKPGFEDKPVAYVSFYDALRFANWLNNGQGSGDTETGAYTLLGGTATPNRANCAFAIGALTDVGAYTGSASPHGTFDQGGNVWEWNEQIGSGSNRGIRGGSWGSGASVLAASGRGNGDPTNENDGFGFRVASLVPEPGTGLLVMGDLLGLAARRRRPAKAL
jgi:hypothetical protein